MKFFYTVSREKGAIERGELTADSALEAEHILTGKGFRVILLKPGSARRVLPRGVSFPFQSRMSLLEKLFFTKHLALLIKAGLPLQEGLSTIREQSESSGTQRIMADLIASVNNGQSLSDSLARHPKTFNRLFRDVVSVGEKTGKLEENLSYLSAQLEKEYTLIKKIVAAMLYPAIIFILAVGVGLFMLTYILPKLLPVFTSLDIELPLATRILIAIGEFSESRKMLLVVGTLYAGVLFKIPRGIFLFVVAFAAFTGPFLFQAVFLGVQGKLRVDEVFSLSSSSLLVSSRIMGAEWILFIGFFVSVKVLFRLSAVQYSATRVFLSVPLFGKLYKHLTLAFFTRNLETLLKSGISVIEALRISAAISSNALYRKKLTELADRVEQGESISLHLGKDPKLFPVILSRMIGVGEKSGNLDETLDYLADFYEKEVDAVTNNLADLLQPFLLIIVGLMAAFIALAVITPIYKFTESIRPN